MYGEVVGGRGGARFIERGTVNYGRWIENGNGGTEGVMCTTNGDIGNIRVLSLKPGVDPLRRRQNLRRSRRRLRKCPSLYIVVYRVCDQMGVGWTGVKDVETKG